MKTTAALLIAVVAAASACSQPRTRETPPAAKGERRPLTAYMRLVYQRRDNDDPGRWIGQLSVRTLRDPQTGATATLVSMQHCALPAFYRSLETHLRDADIVLAEGSGGQPPGQRLPDDQLPQEGLWVRRQHRVVARLMDLEMQGDWEERVADRRWILADMDRKQVLAELDERMTQLLDPDAKARVERLEALLAGSASPEALAEGRAGVERSVRGGFYDSAGPGKPEQALHERREEVMWRIVKERLASGKYRNAALVYGAWHTPVLEARLVSELGFVPEATCWHDAVVFERPPGTQD